MKWESFDKLNDIVEDYMPARGEGKTLASQTVTAVNKLYKCNGKYEWKNNEWEEDEM